MDNIKAEKYLYKRLEIMSDERAMLSAKLDKIQIEIDETDKRIAELQNNVDTAMEVFSPKPVKNDFIKAEIEELRNQKDKFRERFTEFSKQSFFVEESIKELRDILEVKSEEDVIQTDGVTVEEYDVEDEVSVEGDVAEEEFFTVEEEPAVVEAGETVAEAVTVVTESSPKIDGIKVLAQEENERKRIAEDLLHSVVQVLTNLIHKCDICSKIVGVDLVRTKLELENMAKVLRESITETKSIIADLCPLTSDDFNLDDALEQILNKLDDNTDMNVLLDVVGQGQLSDIVQSAVFRMVQNYINDSIKRSDGNNLKVVLQYETEDVYLEITDDGKLFDCSEDNMSNSFQSDMLKERVALLSGSIEIDTTEEGTVTKIRIPMQ